ncbi:MAG: bifunctional riboflavin kinase/FAD synthetase [Candidatus Binatia bacterium]
MQLLRHLARIGRRFDTPVVTLGNFDGVHQGHQEILRRLVDTARALGGQAIVLTFHPHPVAVLSPAGTPRLITDWRSRIERIAAFGVDAIIVQHFTPAFAAMGAETFVRRLLVDGLGVREVVVGHRVSFGHNRTGDADALRRFGKTFGFGVEVVGPVDVDGLPVSSSIIRRAIADGELDRARALLGWMPSVGGRVAHGHHRGKALGFPTINVRVGGLVLPPDGVYAVKVRIRGTDWCGVANLGFNPTFGDHARSLEAHLFDFDGTLYGKRVEIGFVQRLRGERKFPNPQALAEQIARDCAAAREALNRAGHV